jgi:2-keto-4-pentenoate hydratase
MTFTRLFAPLVAFTVALATNAFAGEADLAELLIGAEAAGAPIPHVTRVDPDLDLDAAYRVQKLYVERRLDSDSIAGFKAGFTGRFGRLLFGLGEPVVGVLFASGRGERVIDLAAYRRLIVETEIVFVAGARIDEPVADIAALRRRVRGVAPGIEMPEGGFVDPMGVTAADIVAANVSAAAFLVGPEMQPGDIDLDGLPVALTRDGRGVSRGHGTDAMGDPWRSALWLVNAIVARGHAVEPGHLLFTGVLGKRVEAKPGHYIADFGALGRIDFELR